MSDSPSEHKNNQIINLEELYSVLWLKKIAITIITLFFAISSILYSLSLPNIYQSDVILTPSDRSSEGITGQSALTGLTATLGIGGGGSKANPAVLAVAIMKSWGFTEEIIERNDLKVVLAASKGWNQDNNYQILDEEIYDVERGLWLNEPNSWQLFQKLKSKVSISYKPKDQFITLAVKDYSPYLAKRIVEIYISAINDHMRQRQITQSNKNLIYLEAQLEKINNTSLKQVFYQLILQENKSKMMAEANPEFTFVIVSKPMIPLVKAEPRRSIIVVSLTLFGFLISCLYFLFKGRAKILDN